MPSQQHRPRPSTGAPSGATSSGRGGVAVPRSNADFAHFMAIEQAEESNGWHMSFLDRGLESSPYAANLEQLPDWLAETPRARGAVGGGALGHDAPLPAAGQRPEKVEDLPWLHDDIENASLAVASWSEDGELQARWYGRDAEENDQFWSATKHIQALGLMSLLGSKRPDLDMGELLIRQAGEPETAIPLTELLQDIVSYDEGVGRSNSGAKTLGMLQSTTEREERLESWTGKDADFRGGYGFGPIFEQPEIVTADGTVVATAPEQRGPGGPNLVSAYDLTRVMGMAAWHPHLGEEQQIPGADWRSLEDILASMGWDSARYIDVALERLGVVDQLQNVVVATKLGHGIRSATGLAETVYTGVVQFDDLRTGSAVRRSMVFTLRGEHADSVELDARIAAEVTEILRRVLAEEL